VSPHPFVHESDKRQLSSLHFSKIPHIKNIKLKRANSWPRNFQEARISRVKNIEKMGSVMLLTQ